MQNAFTRTVLYYFAAAALGAGWTAVLAVPRLTGEFIRDLPNRNLALLVVTSVVVAYVFRSWIVKSGSIGAQAGRAIVITYVGCFIYLTLANLAFRFSAPEGLRDWLPRYFWGTVAAMYAFYVVVPYGIVCQLALNRISRTTT